jgi:L-alanine-DL-glutamate epimerase-like enolase superfamily enzyme
MAEIFKRQFVPHHSMSGIGLAAALHLCCCFPGTTWLELMYEPNTRTLQAYQQLGGVLESKIWIDSDGLVSPPTEPGLGVVVNEKTLRRYAV